MPGRWTKSAGGWVLEALNPPDHRLAPNEWMILAFIERHTRCDRWILQVRSELGLGFACRGGTYATLGVGEASS